MRSDEFYMQRALELAEQGRGRTSPNPMVGAVIVNDGEVVGEGYHHQAGTPHAEIHALRMAREAAKGGTLYVTLEPCSHYGRTPPCSEAVIGSGISRVIVAVSDPNPKVSGQGIQRLKAAGIAVEVGLEEEAAKKQNEVFFKYIKTGLPFVMLKAAMTLDGKIASHTGDSKWVSNEASRKYVHQLRGEYDAILVGIGTVLKDDPQLNTRLPGIKARNPVRIVLDPDLVIPETSKLIQTAHEQSTIVFCSKEAKGLARKPQLEEQQAQVIRLGENGWKLPLQAVLGVLANRGLTSLIVEGGGQVHASFLEEQLADKICWFISPKIIGGQGAPSPVGGEGISLMRDAVKVHELEIKRFGEDICIEGKPDFIKS